VFWCACAEEGAVVRRLTGMARMAMGDDEEEE